MLNKNNLSTKDFQIQIGSVIKKFRERYRQATRFSFLDSLADLDLIVLTKEIDGNLVSSDEGVILWGRKFGVKETECLKASRNDPQTCAFRPGFFVPSFSCFSRVRISATSTQVVSLRCGHDESSSSESSEEMFSRGRHQYNIPFANRVPAPSAPPPPIQPGRSFQSQTVEVRPRGDAFSNFLV